MAKFELVVTGSLANFVPFIKDSLQNSSASATLEDESYLDYGSVKIAIISFERYSMFGGNRVSLTVNISEHNDEIAIVGMAGGGSQATFWKVNTVGETNFLEKLENAVAEWQRSKTH